MSAIAVITIAILSQCILVSLGLWIKQKFTKPPNNDFF